MVVKNIKKREGEAVMIGEAPKFTESKYFESDPTWRLTPEAPDKLKKEFESYMNNSMIKRMYPNMKNPHYCWDGKIRDRK